MKEWYLIKPQPTLNSGLEYGEWDNYAEDSFAEVLTETPLGKQIYMCKGQFDGSKFEVEVPTNGIVQSETPDAYTQGWQRQLLTRISDEIQNYKYIRYDDKIWVIMTMPSDNRIYNKCVIHLCNYMLKWQNDNGEIYYYPADIHNATQYNTGIEGGREIHTGYVQLVAYVSLDNITAGLERDKRMFIDVDRKAPTPYVITSKDSVAYSYGDDMRVMRITFTEDEFDPNTDSIEEWLCGYKNPHNISNSENSFEISYRGNPEIRIGGQKTFSVNNHDSSITFSLVMSDIWNNKITLTQTNENSCIISATNFPDMVGADIKLVAADTDGQKSEIIIKMIGGV